MTAPTGISGNPGKRKSNHLVDMNQIFKKMLEWKCVWLEEQKKMKSPPPVHGSLQLLPVPSSFVNPDDYDKVFLPLMLHELWASIRKGFILKKMGIIFENHKIFRKLVLKIA